MDEPTERPSIAERHLQEISTLGQVSQVLRSTLDLEEVLSLIQVELSKLLAVDNFYVALYDEKEDRIWYPLAVKQGQREKWSDRPLSDRLTDRVIQQRKPLLINLGSGRYTNHTDLPPSNALPTAWIGVPLISPDRVVGCLALFSLSPGARFSQADQNLLTIVAGSIGVAIDNALLFEQVQKRAVQLEALNQTMTLITATLDPQKVLAQVCVSISQLTQARRSAIFLLSPEADRVQLAYGHELSAGFEGYNRAIKLQPRGRTACLTTGLPVLIPDTGQARLDKQSAEILRQEGIASFGDFPLGTPDGWIGFLTVYFDSPHKFDADEVELLKLFASQVAIAVANANLYARTDLALSRRVQQLAILESVGRELAAATTTDQLFQTILDYAREFTDSPWGTFELFDAQSQSLVAKASSGYQDFQERNSVNTGISGRAVRDHETINVGDVRRDPDYLDLTGGVTRSQLSIPVSHEGRVLGVLTLESPDLNHYSSADQSFASHMANQVAIAVVNAQLFADVSHTLDRLAAVLNSAREGFLMIEAGGRIMLANPAIRELTGLNPAALTGKSLIDLDGVSLRRLGFLPEEAADLVHTLESGRSPSASRAKLELEGDAIQMSGPSWQKKPRRILERASLPVWRRSAQLAGWMIVLRDVTQEHETAETRKALAEMLWHDLRAPLSTAWTAMQMLEDDLQKQPAISSKSVETVRLAKRSAKRVLNLADSMLDIENLQSGKIEMDLQDLDLAELAGEVAADFTAQASESGIRLRAEFPEDFPKIQADASKIGRVLVNLVDNALKFTPSGGEVVLSGRVTPSRRPASEREIASGKDSTRKLRIEVTVSDTGPGIPLEYRKRVFERFIQVPGVTGRRRGTGLGLTFCRLAVEAHGGNIFVEPRPGGGSIFTFTLPITQNPG
jgi:NtrC-family two-component system sensor histidine kinase KinB